MLIFIYPIYNRNWRLASNEIFSPSNKIHREVGRTNDLSAPLYLEDLRSQFLWDVGKFLSYCTACRHRIPCCVGAGVVLKFEDLFQFCLKSDNSNSLVDGSHGFKSASRGKICCPAIGSALCVTYSKPIEELCWIFVLVRDGGLYCDYG